MDSFSGLEICLAAIVVFQLIVIFVQKKLLATVIIYETQKALLYRNGKFKQLLAAGKHRYWPALGDYVEIVNIRENTINLQEEILTKDQRSVRVNLTLKYHVSDPVKATHQSENYSHAVWHDTAKGMRRLASEVDSAELQDSRGRLEDELNNFLRSNFENYGVTLNNLSIDNILNVEMNVNLNTPD
jgi:regulator of protease activity HflC (stomatin/prohibitin superfamily)